VNPTIIYFLSRSSYYIASSDTAKVCRNPTRWKFETDPWLSWQGLSLASHSSSFLTLNWHYSTNQVNRHLFTLMVGHGILVLIRPRCMFLQSIVGIFCPSLLLYWVYKAHGPLWSTWLWQNLIRTNLCY